MELVERINDTMVTIYSKQNCMQCKFTKNWLEKHEIEYLELDCTKDTDYLDEVRNLGFSALPVIVIDGHEAFYGFNPDKLERCLL